jgi:hypothetical protein
VTWNPETSEPFGGRRMITRAFIAFGDPSAGYRAETDRHKKKESS